MLIYCIRPYGDWKFGDKVHSLGKQTVYEYDESIYPWQEECWGIYGECNEFGDPQIEWVPVYNFGDLEDFRNFKIDSLIYSE